MSHLNLPCFQELVGVVYVCQVRKTMTPTPELQHCVRGYHLYIEEGELPLGKSPRVKGRETRKTRQLWQLVNGHLPRKISRICQVLSSWSGKARYIVRRSKDITVRWSLKEPSFAKQPARCKLHEWKWLTITVVLLLLINSCVKIILWLPATTDIF